MASLVFDAGALIAIERRDRRVGAMLEVASRDGVEIVTSAGCVAQVWRDPARQALLTRALAGIVEHPLDPAAARAVGRLLARTDSQDVVDAAVVLLASDGDVVATSDPRDIRDLASAAGVQLGVIAI